MIFDRGLLVPVIRDVDEKNVLDLSVELTQIAEKARNRKLGIEEMRGGTFTITNVGAIGGTGFTPIINAPDVAILGICRANQQPLFRDGQFSPRLMLPLALSFDHRVIDGADAARPESLRIRVTSVVSKIGTTSTSTGTARTAATLRDRPPPVAGNTALQARKKPTNIEPQSPMKIEAG